MLAFPAGPFKHAGYKVALRGYKLFAYRTYPEVFIIRRITERAAENVAYFFGNVSRFYAPPKYNAFYPPPSFQRNPADRTSSKKIAPGVFTFSPGPSFFTFTRFPFSVFLSPKSPAKKGTPRHKGQDKINQENSQKEKKRIQKNQFAAPQKTISPSYKKTRPA
jgi:hypothetical protein